MQIYVNCILLICTPTVYWTYLVQLHIIYNLANWILYVPCSAVYYTYLHQLHIMRIYVNRILPILMSTACCVFTPTAHYTYTVHPYIVCTITHILFIRIFNTYKINCILCIYQLHGTHWRQLHIASIHQLLIVSIRTPSYRLYSHQLHIVRIHVNRIS